MNWYSFAVIVCLLLLLVGIVLIAMWYLFGMISYDRKVKDIKQFITNDGKNMLVEATSECMDILPEKILEAKKTIEGE